MTFLIHLETYHCAIITVVINFSRKKPLSTGMDISITPITMMDLLNEPSRAIKSKQNITSAKQVRKSDLTLKQ